MAGIFDENKFRMEYEEFARELESLKSGTVEETPKQEVKHKPIVFNEKEFESEYQRYIKELRTRLAKSGKPIRKPVEKPKVEVKKAEIPKKKVEIRPNEFNEKRFAAEYEQFIAELEKAREEGREPAKAVDMPAVEIDTSEVKKSKSEQTNRRDDGRVQRFAQKVSRIKPEERIPKARVGSHRMIKVEKPAEEAKPELKQIEKNNTSTFRSFVRGKKIFIDRAGR